MTAKRFTVDNDGQYWDRKSNKYVTLDHLFYLVEELEKENEQLRKENMEYYHLINCGNCKYHNYDWFDDGEEFEVCEKGHTERLMYNKFCKEWKELE